jgi:hypothetical protein
LLRVFLLALPFISSGMLFYNVFLSQDTSLVAKNLQRQHKNAATLILERSTRDPASFNSKIHRKVFPIWQTAS